MKNFLFASFCAMLFMALGFNATASADDISTTETVLVIVDYDFAPDADLTIDTDCPAPDIMVKHLTSADTDDISTADINAINAINTTAIATGGKYGTGKGNHKRKARKYKRKNNRSKNTASFPGHGRKTNGKCPSAYS